MLLILPHSSLTAVRSVNFKFVPEGVFVSKTFASSLLLLHLALLFLFGHFRWARWVAEGEGERVGE